MKKTLVVVESPAKAKTIEKFLGKKYTVKASMGHLRDLPKSQFGIDVEQDFEPRYINIRGKGDIIKELKNAAKQADAIYLASDMDREGEAIAWHLAQLLKVPVDSPCRIEFNEITKPAIQQALKNPRSIFLPRVDAQQTRRLLDRMVGYKLSPLLWRKVRKGLSAGRVQSVAVNLICEREREIEKFVSEEYWTLAAKLRDKPRCALFEAQVVAKEGKKLALTNEAETMAATQELEEAVFIVAAKKEKERRRNPAAPFTTSSLQQEAARKLGFTTRKTMSVAQQLYEGLPVGGKGPVGLITYMRTDSTRIAESAQEEARAVIASRYGEAYLPPKAPVYSTKKMAQDAHEAIRPTHVELTPLEVESYLSKEQWRLYKLIWERFVASQMNAALYETVSVDLTAGAYRLRANGSILKFAGFMILYTEGMDEGKEEKDVRLPVLEPGQEVKLHKMQPKQHFTEPPPRYTEATLVKTLEEKGIGRPSTYAPIIDTILQRGYVAKAEKKFYPTELGNLVLDLLKEYFKDIVDATFTASLEGQLDSIAEGRETRVAVLRDFYDTFAVHLAKAEEEIGQVELPVEVSDEICERCGRNMVVKQGRYGKFLACPGFPECRNAKPIIKDTGIACPKCQGKIIERRTKRGKVFYGCQRYPECDFVSWDAPLAETCQVCGHFMVRHAFRNGRSSVRCGDENCSSRAAEKTAGKENVSKEKQE